MKCYILRGRDKYDDDRVIFGIFLEQKEAEKTKERYEEELDKHGFQSIYIDEAEIGVYYPHGI